MRHVARTAVFFLALWASASSQGQERAYPSSPIKLLVGFPAGGSVDIAARIFAEKLSERLRQPVIVDNRPGAAGNIAADIAAKSPSDGYTIYFGTSVNVISPFTYKNLSYDPIKDFVPVARLTTTPSILVTNTTLPVKNLQDVVALAKSKPGTLNYGSTGNGTPGHLAAELLNLSAGINLMHVRYKGGPQVINDLVGGEIQFYFSNIPTVLPHIHSNRLRAIAITSRERSALMPDVPTVAEAGYPNFEISSWYGLLAPAKTPLGVVSTLSREARAVLEMKDVKDQLLAQGLEAAPLSSEELGSFMQAEMSKYKKLIEDAKITFD